MAMDNNGDNHQPAGRPDGGQYAPKAGRNTDDDLEPDTGAALGIAGHWLDGQRVAAREAADATVGDDAWYTNKGRELGCEYADAIVDAAIHADDIPAGTTLTDMAFDDEALAEYLEDLDSDSSPDDIRAAATHAAATHAAEGVATPAERAERELKVMERLAVARMRGTYDDDSMHRAMGFAAAIIDARDMLRR